jgi:hypothetical protein
LETKKIGYSHLDAVTGMLGIGDIDSSLNCWAFVNECYKASPLYESVKNAWVPTNLMKWQWFTSEYFIEYK